jgi:para-aminobenzoate synthetase component I
VDTLKPYSQFPDPGSLASSLPEPSDFGLPSLAWSDLVNQPGTVLLDSSLGTPGSQSLLGVAPRTTLRGHLPEIGILQDWLEQGAHDFPEGGLMGWVSYEGEFCFGAYEKIHRWRVAGQRKEPIPTAEFTLNLKPVWSEEKFLDGVRRVQEYIAAGDIYQACLCYPWSGAWEGDAWGFYRRWRALSPAPYAAYWHDDERTILSASPELFLSLQGRTVRTRPIKGTRRRGENAAEEARLRTELLSSEKERAELLMITDLERNDLGRICRTGSVQVEDLFSLETYAHVLHLVSTIRGELLPGLSHPAALAACSPGGSITGAPKLRALEILRELEGRPRGIYTGSIGWFGCNGESSFNIAIRTLEIQHGRASYGTGSGIVADSDPAAEWIETQTKAAGLLAACRDLRT